MQLFQSPDATAAVAAAAVFLLLMLKCSSTAVDVIAVIVFALLRDNGGSRGRGWRGGGALFQGVCCWCVDGCWCGSQCTTCG